MSRIAPLEPPFSAEVADLLAPMMPEGTPPIALFRAFAHNPVMTAAMQPWGSYELSSRLSLTLRDREIVIDRTCARCGCEYEWGVHVAYFSERAGLSAAQIRSLVDGAAEDPCWGPRDRLLIRAVDELHEHADIEDALWDELAEELSSVQLLDLTLLSGWYHAI
jgi:alkylhydroperoxidase family enzyme